MTLEDKYANLSKAPFSTVLVSENAALSEGWNGWVRQADYTLQRSVSANCIVGRVKLPGTQVVGNDVLAEPCVVYLPERVKAVVFLARARSFTAAASDFEARIKVMRNEEIVYQNIFNATAGNLVIPAGEKRGAAPGLDIFEFVDGDMFNVDVVQDGGITDGVELALRGTYALRY